MDAEITSSGDVMVEGQHVGQLNGFRFTSDPGAAGEEARTLNAAAQKALASEIEGRATRVSEAVDEAFVLANDGLIRWLGEPVGRIAAGAHVLDPQVRVIADEQLTGPALELVQRRLDLWVQQHVTKLLGPLRDLEKGDGLDGIARGIAFQTAEALGVLERSRVTDDVKNLPQEARGLLRKLGVRFGAYHLYLPALVKPGPRALAAQLWALKTGGVEEVKGLDEVPHLAASGRTSFVADQTVPKGFYRAAGFRVCGERAVRVDILERLADLIRPAVSYRPGTTPGDPPPGAADNDGFVVTVGMTSLAGCSGEAFGTILKSLGYVLDRRAGPPITVPLVPKAATEPVQLSSSPKAADTTPPAMPSSVSPEIAPPPFEAPTDLQSRVSLARQNELIAAALEGGALEAIEPLPCAAAASTFTQSAEASTVAPPQEPPAAEPAIVAQAADVAETASETDAPTPSVPDVEPIGGAIEVSQDVSSPATEATETPAGSDEASAESVEPTTIEVWRPHRHNPHNRRSTDRSRGPRRAQSSDASMSANDAGTTASGRQPPRQDAPRGRFRDFKPSGQKDGGGPKDNRARPNGHRDRNQRDQRRDNHRQTAMTSEPRAREKQPDPNSPFAKLAALKAQMDKEKS